MSDVLVKIHATIIVKVPDDHPVAQATDGLNDTLRAAAPFVVDWGYGEVPGGTDELGYALRAQVTDFDPETYEEGMAWEVQETQDFPHSDLHTTD